MQPKRMTARDTPNTSRKAAFIKQRLIGRFISSEDYQYRFGLDLIAQRRHAGAYAGLLANLATAGDAIGVQYIASCHRAHGPTLRFSNNVCHAVAKKGGHILYPLTLHQLGKAVKTVASPKERRCGLQRPHQPTLLSCSNSLIRISGGLRHRLSSASPTCRQSAVPAHRC